MTVQNLYTQYLDGKVTKQKFLYEVRRDQNLTMISPTNSFDDVIKILKNKSIISEKASKESKQSTGKQDVEIISKTIDMVNPYEYARGMDYELNIIDVPVTSGDLHTDNVLKAQKKVLANLTKNPQYYFEKLYGKDKFDGDETVEINKKSTDAIGKGKNAKIIREGIHDRDVLSRPLSNPAIEPLERSPEELSKDADGRSENILRMRYYNQIKDPNISDEELRYLLGGKGVKGFGGTPNAIEKIIKDRKFQDGLNESYNPFPMNEEQEAVLKRYAEATGISEDNLKNMVAEARAKKKASKPDFLDLDKDRDKEESMKKAAQDKKQAMSEDVYSDGTEYANIIDLENLTPEQLNIVRQIANDWGLTSYDLEDDVVLADIEAELKIRLQAINSTDPMSENEVFEDDNEPHELHILLAQLAKSAIQLAQDLKALEMEGVDNLPQWFQAKIIIAKSYIQGAREYLEGEMNNGLDEDIFKKGTQQVIANDPASEQKLRALGYQPVPGTSDVTSINK